jgi:methylisocitrate lyase
MNGWAVGWAENLSARTEALRRLVAGKRAVVAPGVFSPAVAKAAEREGFEAVYLSGAAFSGLLALPDLGITTLHEVAKAAYDISAQVRVPLIVDADTGFGEAVNVGRTVAVLKASGAAALHIEDQVMPKRCGHLDGKQIVEVEEMVKKVATAAEAAGGEMMVIARTDARSVEGIDAAVERARAYSRAGADMIFPEALESPAEFAEFRGKLDKPLVANMTEFGKTPYMTVAEFERLGYNVVIFPVTTFRAMMKAVEETLRGLKREGTQEGMLGSLMTRKEFYDLIGYATYVKTDGKAMRTARRLAGSRKKGPR